MENIIDGMKEKIDELEKIRNKKSAKIVEEGGFTIDTNEEEAKRGCKNYKLFVLNSQNSIFQVVTAQEDLEATGCLPAGLQSNMGVFGVKMVFSMLALWTIYLC